jgi:hypothetical protein
LTDLDGNTATEDSITATAGDASADESADTPIMADIWEAVNVTQYFAANTVFDKTASGYTYVKEKNSAGKDITWTGIYYAYGSSKNLKSTEISNYHIWNTDGDDLGLAYCGDHNKASPTWHGSGSYNYGTTSWDTIPVNKYIVFGNENSDDDRDFGATCAAIIKYGEDNELDNSDIALMLNYARNGGSKPSGYDTAVATTVYSKGAASPTVSKVGSSSTTTVTSSTSNNKTKYVVTVNETSSTSATVTTSKFKITGTTNTATFKVPTNMTLHQSHTVNGETVSGTVSAGNTATLRNGYTYWFTWKRTDSIKSSVSATFANKGYQVYEFSPVYYLKNDNTEYHFQNLFQLGDAQSYAITIKFKATENSDGMIKIQKKSTSTKISNANSAYNMAGIKYSVYSNSAATTYASVTSVAWECECGETITPQAKRTIVLSYNGYAYMDHDGKNVIFTSEAAKNRFEEEEGYLHWYRYTFLIPGGADSATYYLQEDKTLALDERDSGTRPYYYYNEDGKNRYSLHGESVSKSGYAYNSKIYTCNVDANEAEWVYPKDNPETGKVRVDKAISNDGATALAKGLKIQLQRSTSNTDANYVTVAEWTVNSSGKGIPTSVNSTGKALGIYTNYDGEDIDEASQRNFLGLPYGYYKIVEDTTSATNLGLTKVSPSSGEYKFTISAANFSSTGNNIGEFIGGLAGAVAADSEDSYTYRYVFTNSATKVKVTKQYNGTSNNAAHMKGLKFTLYKEDSATGTDTSKNRVVATFTHNGTKVVPSSIGSDFSSTYKTKISGDYVINIPAGYYYLVEDANTAKSLGFTPATGKTVKITSTTTEITLNNTAPRISFKKIFGDTNLCNNGTNPNYSLEGAEFSIYAVSAKGDTTDDATKRICDFTTNADGVGVMKNLNTTNYSNLWTEPASIDSKTVSGANLAGIPIDTWLYVVETKASEGCDLADPMWIQFTSDLGTKTYTVKEPLVNDPFSLQIQKVDSLTGEAVSTGDSSLAGAEFTVKYYAVDVDKYTTLSSIAGLKATRTWVLVTDEDGKIYGDTASYYKAGSDEVYTRDSGIIVIPRGVITIEETKSPEGYTTSGSYVNQETGETISGGSTIFAVIKQKDDLISYLGTETVNKTEVPNRGDIVFRKITLDTKESMAGVPFRITASTGESHIVVTDENGIVDTSAIAHSQNTNANDDAADGEYTECGVWFYGNAEGTGTIDDAQGALAFDTYTIEELPSAANEGYRLVATATVTELGSTVNYVDGYYKYDLGDITNVLEPKIYTQVYCKDTDSQLVPADSITDFTDTVNYEWLTAGETYTVKGVVIDKTTEKPYVNADGTYCLGKTTFTVDSEYSESPYEKFGSVVVDYKIDTTGIDSDKELVVYEYLYEGASDEDLVISEDGTIDTTGVLETNKGNQVYHADITDEKQTLYVPTIGTQLTDDTYHKETQYCESVTLIDTVSYNNLIPGKSYEMKGTLYNKETEKALLDADGNEITASTSFVASAKAGTVEVKFTFNATIALDWSEHVVAFEDCYDESGKIKIATHADINDDDQTIEFPHISTQLTGKTSKDHFELYSDTMELVDTISYTNLPTDEELKFVGKLYNAKTGKILKDSTGEITVEEAVTLKDSDATYDMTYKFNALEALPMNADGTVDSVVCFEYVYGSDGRLLAKHEDLTDASQTIDVPTIGTTLVDSETDDHVAYYDSSIVLVDTIDYKNLVVGKEYSVEGVLMNQDTESPVLVDGKEVTATGTFVPENTSGTTQVTFTFDATKSDLIKDDGTISSVVAFESVYLKGVLIAEHKDLTDGDQTVDIPTGHTEALDDKTGTHTSKAEKKCSITDTVFYENLLVGKEYTVEGKLMVQGTGKVLKVNGEPVTASATFTPKKSTGTVKLTFTFDASALEGKSVVVFEDCYKNGIKVFTHADLSDEAQTVHFPKIGTTATNGANGSKTLDLGTEISLIDTVKFSNLTTGDKYLIKGKVMDKETGKIVKVTAGSANSELEFVAETSDGSVDVEFNFNTTGLGGKTLVVFEEVYTYSPEGDLVLVATHDDLDDEGQSVDIPDKPHTPKTGDTMRVGIMLAILLLSLAGMTGLIIYKKKSNN